jgi:hypothetical protein
MAGVTSALGVATTSERASSKGQSGTHLQHFLTIAPGKTSAKATALIRSWSQTDLTLDPATFVPSSLKFNIHPDNNSSANLPVEVRYSNYKNVSGVELPMHIERYVNGGLQLCIDIDSAIVN